MAGAYKRRVAKVKQLLKEKNGSLLVTSAPVMLRSRDTAFPYRQNSDFFYLTGTTAPDLALLVSGQRGAFLIAPPVDEKKVVWEGAPPSYRSIAREIGAELIVTDRPRQEILQQVKGAEILYHQNLPLTLSAAIGNEIAGVASHLRNALPKQLAHVDVVLEPMRLRKEPGEIRAIRSAANLANEAMTRILPQVTAGVTERDIACAFDYLIRLNGGEPAFNTICAAGPSAATLHYEERSRTLREGDMLLFDCGAEFEMYCSDVTRVIPVSGAFSPLQREMYEIVLSAQLEALKKVKHNALAKNVFDAAALEITIGLIELGVLRGKASKLLKKRAFAPYFPHGIGHTLGLDVHDVGRMRGDEGATLSEQMVVTIEPGLYFAKKTGNIPPCGIRIEDTVLVKRSGYEILTNGFPKGASEIEELMGMEELVLG